MSDLEHARALVLRYGWNATAYQLVNPGIDYWFTPDGEGVVGYVRAAGVWVAAGAPVCEPGRLAEVAAAFEARAAAAGVPVCYFGAEARLESIYRGRPGYAMVRLGSQPVWAPGEWPEIIAGRASLRAQLNRARNKGVVVEEWSAAQADRHPELRRCLEEWLETRGLPPLHFMVEPDTLARLWDRRIFVALRHGRVTGFLVLSPVPVRHGWLVEQVVRGHDAPNGTAELMLDAASRSLIRAAAGYVTLGLAPLSDRGDAPPPRNPFWLRLVLGWVRAHGRRFYNFRGLETFKAKFSPSRWEPVFAIVNRPRFSPRMLYATAKAFTVEPPFVAVGRAILRAARQEVRWLRER
ncbi:MAG: phosphatidylglycerol lysyltransferase domain-containing protein [Gemmatimonadales bacterium]